MKRVLLTGACGFVGARIRRQLGSQLELCGVPRGWMARMDQNDLDRYVEEAHPDIILHTAAISDTRQCEEDPQASFRANVLIPQWLAMASVRCGAKLVAFSSDQVYSGLEEPGPLPEDIPLHPDNVYGRHKLEAEQRVLFTDPNAVLLRAGWMYDLPGYELPIRQNLPLQLLHGALHGQTLTFSPRDRRGVTYVRQAVTNLPAAIQLPGGVYNYGSENDLDMLATARQFCRAMGIAPTLAEGDRVRNLCMDTAKARRAGVVFDTTCDGIAQCLRDYGLENGF